MSLALIKAIETNDIKAVTALLAEGVDLNCVCGPDFPIRTCDIDQPVQNDKPLKMIQLLASNFDFENYFILEYKAVKEKKFPIENTAFWKMLDRYKSVVENEGKGPESEMLSKLYYQLHTDYLYQGASKEIIRQWEERNKPTTVHDLLYPVEKHRPALG